VQGDSVRIRSGIFTVDCRIERRPNGGFYVRKPESMFIHPGMLGAMVAAALEAYQAAEREISGL